MFFLLAWQIQRKICLPKLQVIVAAGDSFPFSFDGLSLFQMSWFLCPSLCSCFFSHQLVGFINLHNPNFISELNRLQIVFPSWLQSKLFAAVCCWNHPVFFPALHGCQVFIRGRGGRPSGGGSHAAAADGQTGDSGDHPGWWLGEVSPRQVRQVGLGPWRPYRYGPTKNHKSINGIISWYIMIRIYIIIIK